MYANQCFENSRSHISPFWSDWLAETQWGRTEELCMQEVISFLVYLQLFVQKNPSCCIVACLRVTGLWSASFCPGCTVTGPSITYVCTARDCSMTTDTWSRNRANRGETVSCLTMSCWQRLLNLKQHLLTVLICLDLFVHFALLFYCCFVFLFYSILFHCFI